VFPTSLDSHSIYFHHLFQSLEHKAWVLCGVVSFIGLVWFEIFWFCKWRVVVEMATVDAKVLMLSLVLICINFFVSLNVGWRQVKYVIVTRLYLIMHYYWFPNKVFLIFMVVTMVFLLFFSSKQGIIGSSFSII
jgi:hypothetical protein